MEQVIEVDEVRQEQLYQIVQQPQELKNAEFEQVGETQEYEENIRVVQKLRINDDLAAGILQESRQIAFTVSQEEVMLLILQNKNIQMGNIKQYNREIKTHFENLLEHELQPNIYEENQQCFQIKVQMSNSELLINKLKAVMQEIECRQSDLQKQKENIQCEYDKRQATLKALIDKKKVLLRQNNAKLKFLKDKEFKIAELLEKLMKLEDCYALITVEKIKKTDRHNNYKNELVKFESQTNLQNLAIGELNAKKDKDLSELQEISAELILLQNNYQYLLQECELKEAIAAGNVHKMRLDSIIYKLNYLNDSIHNKISKMKNLHDLREEIIQLEKQKETLNTNNHDFKQSNEEIQAMLRSLQINKEKRHCNVTEKLKQEKNLYTETADITYQESNYEAKQKLQKEEETVLEKLFQRITDCKAQLTEQTQKFENEIRLLTKSLNEHNMNYEKSIEYKNIITKDLETCKSEYEQQLKVKMAEVDTKTTENEETKEELEKSLHLMDTRIRLKNKLEKEKASILDDYRAKYFSVFGVRATLTEDVKGILKSTHSSPVSSKKVTFQGLLSETSSVTSSQTKSVEPKEAQLNTIFDIIRQLPNRPVETKKRKFALDSPK